MEMGRTTQVVTEFLSTEKDCELFTNEILMEDVYQIAERTRIPIVNPEGKRIRFVSNTELTHYIKYAETE